jgi:hypothetical protein
MNRLVLLVIILTLGACESILDNSAGEGYLISEIIIRNYSSVDLKDVKLSVERSGGLFGCNYIISMTECSTSFPARSYVGNIVEITWKLGDQLISTGWIRIAVSEGIKRDREMKGIVEIRNNGQYSAYLVN